MHEQRVLEEEAALGGDAALVALQAADVHHVVGVLGHGDHDLDGSIDRLAVLALLLHVLLDLLEHELILHDALHRLDEQVLDVELLVELESHLFEVGVVLAHDVLRLGLVLAILDVHLKAILVFDEQLADVAGRLAEALLELGTERALVPLVDLVYVAEDDLVLAALHVRRHGQQVAPLDRLHVLVDQYRQIVHIVDLGVE